MAAPTYQKLTPPTQGTRVTVDAAGKWHIPDDPIGCGFRSINVFLRIKFDLYACVRPVRYFKGVEAPNTRADKVNMVIFRENTEDVYCGVEFKSGTDRAKKVLALLKEMGYNLLP